MSKRTARAGISAIVIAGCIGLLMYQTVSESAQYYKMVDEVMVRPWPVVRQAAQDARLRRATSRSNAAVDSLDIQLQHPQRQPCRCAATYTGSVPGYVQGRIQVVLTGRLTPAGFEVEPGGIMAKCPSKYEPQPGRQAPPGNISESEGLRLPISD